MSENQVCTLMNLAPETDSMISAQGVYSSGSTSSFGLSETFTTGKFDF